MAGFFALISGLWTCRIIPFTKREILRKRYYIIFVSRTDDGALRKIPVPLHHAYIFLAAAVVGLFTITGLAGSYSRMLLKTARFNQVRTESETLRKDYLHMEHVAHEKDVQAASLGSLASEVSVLYGLEQDKHGLESSREQSKHGKVSVRGAALSTTASSDGLSDKNYHESLEQLVELRASAMSGQVARRLDLTERFPLGAFDSGSDFIATADTPTLWPVQGRVTSSFGERLDPINGEGAFHTGIDIATDLGDEVRATADGTVMKAQLGNGYGREVVIDHGHGVETVYAHLSGFAVTAGQDVHRGDVIGYVGTSGRSTGPHLHYEVRIHDTPVNPHKYLRDTMPQFASSGHTAATTTGGAD
jgi:murein DD-endopeptidase MepM/ murein hydrolase activator NlpD